jgi:hypothetical protein
MVHKPKSSHKGLHALQRKQVNTSGRIAAYILSIVQGKLLK